MGSTDLPLPFAELAWIKVPFIQAGPLRLKDEFGVGFVCPFVFFLASNRIGNPIAV